MKNKQPQKNIPEGWSLTPVGEVFSFIRTHAFSRDNLINGTGNSRGIGNIHYGDIHSTYASSSIDLESVSVPMIKDEGFVPDKEDLLKDGDLVMADASEDYAGVGVTVSLHGLRDKKVTGGLHTFVLRDTTGKTHEHFRQYVFRNPEIRNSLQKIANGVSVYGISKTALSKISLLLPSLPEQSRIAALLETWDQAIQKLSQKIEKKKSIKKGLMQQLLRGENRLPGFTEKWKSYSFGDLASPRKERFDPKESSESQFCVELEHIESGSGRLLGHGDSSSSLSLKTIFYPNDILFGKLRAYLKKYWLATNKGVCSTEIWALEVNKSKVIPSIIYNIVQSAKFISIASMSQGTHMPRSNWEIVQDYEVLLPNIEEQICLGNILSAVDKEIKILEHKLKILQKQKIYLFNNLVTGSIRIPGTQSVHI